MNEKTTKRGILLIFAICTVSQESALWAQSSHLVTATVGFEITEQYWPVYEVTYIYGRSWGIRYSNIADFDFEEDTEIVLDSGSVSSYSISGDYEMPSVVYIIENKEFPDQNDGPFNFLTAYITAGYHDTDIELKETKYSAIDGKIATEIRTQNAKIPVYAFSFGFLGGEKFVVLDTKIIYLRGRLDDSEVLDRKMKFDHWLAVFSLGFGF